jgi:hypothetical protein
VRHCLNKIEVCHACFKFCQHVERRDKNKKKSSDKSGPSPSTNRKHMTTSGLSAAVDSSSSRARLAARVQEKLHAELCAEVGQQRVDQATADDIVAAYHEVSGCDKLTALRDKLFAQSPNLENQWEASMQSLVRDLKEGPGGTDTRWLPEDKVGQRQVRA